MDDPVAAQTLADVFVAMVADEPAPTAIAALALTMLKIIGPVSPEERETLAHYFAHCLKAGRCVRYPPGTETDNRPAGDPDGSARR